MALPVSHKLFIEPTLGVAYASFSGSTQISNPSFFLGDKAQLEIYLVKDTGLATFPRQEADYSGLSFKVAVGQIDESPTGGTWQLSYGGNTTSALAYNATAAQVQTALNALASITAAGGVVVTKVGDNYNVVFNQDGARTELTADTASLTPLSTAGISSLQEGTVSQPAIYLVHLQRTIAAFATSFTQVSASTASVTALSAWDGGRATYRVSISPDPKGGTFTLAFDAQTGTDVTTSAISVGASALDVQNALNRDALLNKVTVQQVGAYAWDVTVTTQPGTNGLTVSGAGLLSFSGFKGELNLNTAAAIALLDGADFIQTTLEVEITSDSKPLTVLQIPCLLKSAVVDEAAVQPLVLDTYLSQATADGRYYRLSNNLSEGTASTIRTNLDVYSTSQVDTALALKLSAANNLSELTPTAATARTNLGLGTMATETASNYLTKAGNLSGLTDTSVARTNLGLGTMALQSAGNYALLSGANFSGNVTITSNSSNPALTITQTGSGDVLRLNDEGADLTFTFINSDGKLCTIPSTATSAGFNIPEGTSPSINIQAGDVFATSSGLYYKHSSNAFISQIPLSHTANTFSANNTFNGLQNTFGGGSGSTITNVGTGSVGSSESKYIQIGTGATAGTTFITIGPTAGSSSLTVNAGVYTINGSITLNGNLTASSNGITARRLVGVPNAGVAGVNIGIGGTDAANTTPGDLWIASGGVSLNFRDATGSWRQCLTTSSAGVIDVNSANTALRVTQRGAGDAIRVEDSTSPDASAFIVDSAGRVGIGATPDATSALTIDGSTLGAVKLQNNAYIDVGASGKIQWPSAGVSDVSSQTNPNTSGNFSHTTYGLEMLFTVPGVGTYAVPARLV